MKLKIKFKFNEKQKLKSQYSKNCKRRNIVIYSSVITKNSGCWNHTIQDLITVKKKFKKKRKNHKKKTKKNKTKH